MVASSKANERHVVVGGGHGRAGIGDGPGAGKRPGRPGRARRLEEAPAADPIGHGPPPRDAGGRPGRCRRRGGPARRPPGAGRGGRRRCRRRRRSPTAAAPSPGPGGTARPGPGARPPPGWPGRPARRRRGRCCAGRPGGRRSPRAGSGPRSRCSTRIWSTVVMMVAPPGEPMASTGRPSRNTMVGLIEERGRLPGAGRLGSGTPANSGVGVEVGQLVVEQEPVAGDDDAAAAGLLDGQGVADHVAPAVGHASGGWSPAARPGWPRPPHRPGSRARTAGTGRRAAPG